MTPAGITAEAKKAGKKGLKMDGTERLLMTGYGGFNVSITPTWNPAWAWWMQQGGWFAVPNLRGGGEYARPAAEIKNSAPKIQPVSGRTRLRGHRRSPPAGCTKLLRRPGQLTSGKVWSDFRSDMSEGA